MKKLISFFTAAAMCASSLAFTDTFSINSTVFADEWYFAGETCEPLHDTSRDIQNEGVGNPLNFGERNTPADASAAEIRAINHKMTVQEVKYALYKEIDEHWDLISTRLGQPDREKMYALFLGLGSRESTLGEGKIGSDHETAYEDGWGVNSAHAYGTLQTAVTAFAGCNPTFMPEDNVPEMFQYDFTESNFYDCIISNHMGIRKILHFAEICMNEENMHGYQVVRNSLKGFNTGWCYMAEDDGAYKTYADEICSMAQFYYNEGHLYDNVFTWTSAGGEMEKYRTANRWDWWGDTEPSMAPIEEKQQTTTAATTADIETTTTEAIQLTTDPFLTSPAVTTPNETVKVTFVPLYKDVIINGTKGDTVSTEVKFRLNSAADIDSIPTTVIENALKWKTSIGQPLPVAESITYGDITSEDLVKTEVVDRTEESITIKLSFKALNTGVIYFHFYPESEDKNYELINEYPYADPIVFEITGNDFTEDNPIKVNIDKSVLAVGETANVEIKAMEDFASCKLECDGDCAEITTVDDYNYKIKALKASEKPVQFKATLQVTNESHRLLAIGTYNVTFDITITDKSSVKYGDANCDGEVSLADAVLIMQSLANPSKYGTEGNDENRITSQGQTNADCSNVGDGMTNKDALAIQKFMLNIIDSLPETTE